MILEKILNNKLCCGCGLCESISSSLIMKVDENGFLRPQVIFKIEKAHELIIKSICPGINSKPQNNQTAYKDKIWGNFESIHKAFSKDPTIRKEGASGGIITTLALHFSQKYKMPVIQIAPSKNPFFNETQVNNNSIQILNASGSRYSPSSPLNNIINILESESKIIFIGKPCDIVGLNNFLKSRKDLEKKVFLTISFFCAGVPSYNGTSELLNANHVQIDKLKYLKYRGDGWPGFFQASDINGNIVKISYNDSWGKVLNKYLQHRCKICNDGTGESADIVCGDAWKMQKNGYPDFNEREGVSLVILRTKKGKELYEKLNGEFIYNEQIPDYHQYLKNIQPYQYQRKLSLFYRLAALKLFGKKIPNYDFWTLGIISLKLNPLKGIRNFVGMIKRILKS